MGLFCPGSSCTFVRNKVPTRYRRVGYSPPPFGTLPTEVGRGWTQKEDLGTHGKHRSGRGDLRDRGLDKGDYGNWGPKGREKLKLEKKRKEVGDLPGPTPSPTPRTTVA